MPSQDTNEHNLSDASHQQPLYNDSGGQTIPLGQLKMETQAIASFSTTDLCQKQSNPSSSPPIPPLVCDYSSQCIPLLPYIVDSYH